MLSVVSFLCLKGIFAPVVGICSKSFINAPEQIAVGACLEQKKEVRMNFPVDYPRAQPQSHFLARLLGHGNTPSFWDMNREINALLSSDCNIPKDCVVERMTVLWAYNKTKDRKEKLRVGMRTAALNFFIGGLTTLEYGRQVLADLTAGKEKIPENFWNIMVAEGMQAGIMSAIFIFAAVSAYYIAMSGWQNVKLKFLQEKIGWMPD